MKYKIGDRVKVKSIEWYNETKSNDGFIFCRSRYFIPDMSTFCGCILTIKAVGYDVYYTEENIFAWNEYMFEEFTDYKENMKNMENMEITLNDKNYIIDVEKAKELGVLKEKDSRCKSWEEFKKKYLKKHGYFYDEWDMCIALTNNPTKISEQLTKNEAIAIKAFSKLLKLRRDWIGTWDPDWSYLECKRKYCIICRNNNITIGSFDDVQHTFSFPTEEMASEFLKHFWDLFVQCKCII